MTNLMQRAERPNVFSTNPLPEKVAEEIMEGRNRYYLATSITYHGDGTATLYSTTAFAEETVR